jgi:hypothetical protein
MNIDSSIEVTLPNGRVLNLKNSLTYGGVDILASAIAGRSTINFTHFYIRHATVKSDADDPETNFHVNKDLHAVTHADFTAENGSAGYSILDLNTGIELRTSDTQKYTQNVVKFPVTFNAIDMGLKFKDTNQSNYSIIYYMGLASRPMTIPAEYVDGTQTELDEGKYDVITSVIKLGENDYFGIPNTGTVSVGYDLKLAV